MGRSKLKPDPIFNCWFRLVLLHQELASCGQWAEFSLLPVLKIVLLERATPIHLGIVYSCFCATCLCCRMVEAETVCGPQSPKYLQLGPLQRNFADS